MSLAGSTTSSNGALPINNLIGVNVPSTTPQAQSTAQQLGEDAFLKLLTVQLKNQDPLKPMDDTQTIAQLAQFTQVQSTNELKNSFEKFQSQFGITQSAGFLGQKVSAQVNDGAGNQLTVIGTVKSIAVQNGQPLLSLVDANGNPLVDANGKPYAISVSQIVGIGTGGLPPVVTTRPPGTTAQITNSALGVRSVR